MKITLLTAFTLFIISFSSVTAQNVGIGESSPATRLDIRGNTSGDLLNIKTNAGLSRLYVRENGNVGIGTTTPGHPLTIEKNAEWNVLTRSANTTSTNRNHFLSQRANGTSAVPANFTLGGLAMGGFDGTDYSLGWNGGAEITAFASQNWTNTNRGTFITIANTPDNSTTITERLRIEASGNIGIGTPTPNGRLDVKSAGNTSGTYSFGVRNIDNVYGLVVRDDNNVGIGTTAPGQKLTIDGTTPIAEIRTGGYLMLRPTDNTWDMRLQTVGTRLDVLSGGSLGTPIASFLHGGNVGIGTTAPATQLDVQGSRTIKQGDLTTYTKTFSTGISGATFSIARQYHDIVNWGYGGIVIEEFSTYQTASNFDYGMFIAKWGYNNSVSVATKIAGAFTPFYTGQTYTGVGNNYYRDIQITLPAYHVVTVKVSTAMPVTTNISNTTQNYVYFHQ
jgi:hypothetical protein